MAHVDIDFRMQVEVNCKSLGVTIFGFHPKNVYTQFPRLASLPQRFHPVMHIVCHHITSLWYAHSAYSTFTSFCCFKCLCVPGIQIFQLPRNICCMHFHGQYSKLSDGAGMHFPEQCENLARGKCKSCMARVQTLSRAVNLFLFNACSMYVHNPHNIPALHIYIRHSRGSFDWFLAVDHTSNPWPRKCRQINLVLLAGDVWPIHPFLDLTVQHPQAAASR